MSVIVLCHDYAQYLPAAIESVLSQEGVSAQVIVVDDASTDASLRVANSYAERDSRVEVIAHQHNCGPVQTFNDGLARVTGEFIVRLDADDLLTPGSLGRAVDLAREFPDVGLVYGHPVHFLEGARPRSRDRSEWGEPVTVLPGHLPGFRATAEMWTVTPGQRWLADRCRQGVNVITSPEALMRSTVVQRVGGQRCLDHAHDMEMWFRISAVSDVGYISGADQAWHREHPGSLSATARHSLYGLRDRRDAFDVLFDGVGHRLPQLSSMRESASRALAHEALERACRAYDRGRTETEPVAELEAFALEIYGPVRHLWLWRALQIRKAVGATFSHRFPPFLASGVWRRLKLRSRQRRWRRWGVS